MNRKTALAAVIGCALLAAPVSASTTTVAAPSPQSPTEVADSALVATAAELSSDPVVVPAARTAREWVGQEGANVTPEQVPTVVLDAYTTAVAVAPRSCNVTVPLLAAVGQVESGNLVGRQLDASHAVTPALVGPRLDGGAFASVRDTDGGRLDGDKKFDRAVGPMQFLPTTWRSVGVDMDADGKRDPQNIYDAAGAAMVYLCGTRDLSDPAQLRKAILSYNRSAAYVQQVLTWKQTFETKGLGAVASLPIFSASASGATTPAVLGGQPTGSGDGSTTTKPGKKPVKDAKPGKKPSVKPKPKPGAGTPTPGPGPTPTDPPTGPPTGEPTPGEPTPEPTPAPEVPAFETFPACDVAPAPVEEQKPVTEADYALGASWSDSVARRLLLTYDSSTPLESDICQAPAATTSPSPSPSPAGE